MADNEDLFEVPDLPEPDTDETDHEGDGVPLDAVDENPDEVDA